MSNNTVEQIKSAVTSAGYGSYLPSYTGHVERAAARIDNGEDVFTAMRAEAPGQVSDYNLRQFASRVTVEAPAEAPESEYLTESQFATCVAIGVEFGAREDAVVAALIENGLYPEPTPEPEPEDDSTEGSFASIKATLDSLVAFAKRHGFNG